MGIYLYCVAGRHKNEYIQNIMYIHKNKQAELYKQQI